ncbi:unnamed protein product, partial [marine sediment metagenome]
VRCKGVEERTNVLPRVYQGSYFVSKGSLKRKSWDNLIRKAFAIDPDRPIIFMNENGCICLPNLGKQHEKLDWNGPREGPKSSPCGADRGPVSPSRARRERERREKRELIHGTSPTKPEDAPGEMRTYNDYPEKFLDLWKHYPPLKGSKPATFKKCNALIKRGIPWEDLISAAKNYETSRTDEDPQYSKRAETFYGPQEFWKEYVEGVPEDAVKKPKDVDGMGWLGVEEGQ